MDRDGRVRHRARTRTTDACVWAALAGLAAAASLSCGGAGALPAGDYSPRPFAQLAVPPARARAAREDALARARVWMEPEVPVERAGFLHNPGGPHALPDELACRYYEHLTPGSTPKVYCILPGGEVIKVKYGAYDPEIQAELAGARLARALGFGADEMSYVRTVRCFGCPAPQGAHWRERLLALGPALTFHDVSVERRFPGKEVMAAEGERGWGFYELAKIRAEMGGSSRAEVDALRLFAVLLGHWDNKAENQRLVCLPGADRPDGTCASSFAFIQDLGATFGPPKVDLEGWRGTPVWADAATCRVSLKSLPFAGGTFPDTTVSEAGRAFLAGLLDRLTPDQRRDLFVGAHFSDYVGQSAEGRDVLAWVSALDDKIRQIRDRPPCP